MADKPSSRSRRAIRLALDALALVALILIVGIAVLAWEFSRGPINLAVLKPQMEAALSRLRDGQPVQVAALVLDWSEDRRWVTLRARSVVALGGAGLPEIVAEEAEIAFAALPLLQRRIVPRDVTLKSGRLLLVDPRHAELKGWVDTLAASIERARTQREPISIEDVNLTDFEIEFVDGEQQPLWRLTDVGGTARIGHGGLTFSAQGRLPPAPAIAGANTSPVTLLGRLDTDRPGFRIDMEVHTADLAAVSAAISPRSRWLYTGKVHFSTRIEYDPYLGLAPVWIDAAGEKGRLVRTGKNVSVHDFSAAAFYDPANRTLVVRNFELDGETLRTTLSGTLRPGPIDEGNSSVQFDMTFTDLGSSDPDWFVRPVSFEAVKIKGNYFPSLHRLKMAQASVDIGSFLMSGNLETWREGNTREGRPGLTISATGEGRFDRDSLLAYWPIFLVPDGREWVQMQTVAGVLRRLTLRLDFPPEILFSLVKPDDSAHVAFGVEDYEIRTVPGFPSAKGISGQVVIRGNGVEAAVERARFGSWEVTEAEIDVGRLFPYGEPGRLRAKARGDLAGMFRILDEAELNMSGREIDLDRVAGEGQLELDLLFPTEKMTPEELAAVVVPYTAKGDFENVTLPDIVGEFGLSNAYLRLEGDEKQYRAEGAGRFADATINFEWGETIVDRPNVTESRLRVQGSADEITLNTFGLPARGLMQGPVHFSMTGAGTGIVLHTIEVEYDFSDTDLDLRPLSWSKATGIPASARSLYVEDQSGHGRLQFDASAEDLELAADVDFDADGDLVRARVEKVKIPDRFDGRGALSFNADTGYLIEYEGERFNIAPLLEALADGIEIEQVTMPPVRLGMDVASLGLRGGEALRNANVRLDFSGSEFNSIHASGAIGADKRFSMALSREQKHSVMKLGCDDFGFLLRGLLDSPAFEAGRVDATVTFTEEGASARLGVRDARLIEAPGLAKILTLASIRGLADTLAGNGLLFSEIDLPLEISDGRILVSGARASGPGLGLTARGWLAYPTGGLALDGVIVPSYGINSALGNLPLIGDLFTSREGEGLFAFVYSVRGMAEDAEIQVNPFSILTPGILRRVFENPAQPPPEEAVKPEGQVAPKTDAERGDAPPDLAPAVQTRDPSDQGDLPEPG